MKKQYIQPLTEVVNVRLSGAMLDQAPIAGWSDVAAGDNEGYVDANAYTFDEEEGNNDMSLWQPVGGTLWDE